MRTSRITRQAVGRTAAVCLLSLGLLSGPARGTGVAGGDSGAGKPASPSYQLEGLSWVIDSLMARPELAGAKIGILVESLATGEILYERNADEPLVPASNMKIVTGAVALSVLRPDFTFVTEVATDAGTLAGTIDGNLYVKGRGDPSFVTEELWKLVESVQVLGIERVTGDLVLDTSYFDSVTAASPEAIAGERAYHARTGALSLNFNAVAVHITPGPRSGDPAMAALAPETNAVVLANKAVTGAARRRSTIEVSRAYEDGVNVVTVEGAIPAGTYGTTFYRSIDNAVDYFGRVAVEFLARAGIRVEGSVRVGKVPDGARVITVHESKPLSLVVRDLNKFSSNFVAEQLMKVIAAEVLGQPGTTAGGIAAMEDFLASIGADRAGYAIRDGSGFSRENRLSPRVVCRCIRHALSDFGTAYEFGASLSVSGTDGTLEDRMGFAGLEGSVRAKTGLLDGVTAISGIMRTSSGRDVLFSIIVNGFACQAWRAHDLEHGILGYIHGS